MKKIIIFVIVLSTVRMSCNPFHDDTVFNSNKLHGKYKVDLSPIIAEATKSKKSDDEIDKVGKGLAGLVLSAVDISLTFYENQKGVMTIGGAPIDLYNLFSSEPFEKIEEFVYKVKDDSLLYVKRKGHSEFSKWAEVKKFSDNYDHLQFLIYEGGKESVYFNLSKIAGEGENKK